MRLLLASALALLGACHQDTAGVCDGLTLAECRVTDGCKPDTCFACFCDQSYRGCIAASATPADCPALGCPSADCCSTQADCSSGGATCAPPGTPMGCGACNPAPGDCSTDADCKAADPRGICEPLACSCAAAKSCTPGCIDDTTCEVAETCDVATARCVPRSCGAGCPPNFDCAGSTCARRACASDLECDGYCVDGACYEQTGTCMQPVP